MKPNHKTSISRVLKTFMEIKLPITNPAPQENYSDPKRLRFDWETYFYAYFVFLVG